MELNSMKWILIISLFLLWLAGIILRVDEGGAIHILIIAATALLVYDLLKKGKSNIIKID